MSEPTRRRKSPLHIASVVLNEASTALLIAILALITLDVITRNLGSTGILGTIEIVMLLLIIAVTGALPQLERTNEFLRVDILQERLAPLLRRIVQVILKLIQLIVAALLAWRVAEYALQQMQTGRQTDILRLPIYVPYWVAAACFVVLTIATVVQLIRLFIGPLAPTPEPATEGPDLDGMKGALS